MPPLMSRNHHRPSGPEDGVALLSSLMVLLLLSSLLVGFTAMISSETKMGALDTSETTAFYTAHAGLEKLTTDLGTLFSADFAPTGAEVLALGNAPPTLPGVSWSDPAGADGYEITFPTTPGGDPLSQWRTVTEGPFAGFIGLATEYRVRVSASLPTGGHSGLDRVLQTVSIPVYQFGTFSEPDLSFFAGPVFNFGGRVHTNGHLFLAANSGLTLSDKVTAVGEVVRSRLANGMSTSGRTGPVDVVTTPGNFRNLTINEGSVTGDENSAANEPTWTSLSTGVYNSNITSGRTGARRLDLPIVSQGAQPIDLVRRPAAGEDPNGAIFPQRFFGLASIRILLSDTAADITSLPTVSAGEPIELDDRVDTGGDPNDPWPGYTVNTRRPPLARSNGNAGQGYAFPLDETLHGGFIKIDVQDAYGTWTDVTNEILRLGIANRNIDPACANASYRSNGVIQLQRIRYDGNLVDPLTTGCGQRNRRRSQSGYDYWPLVLYDTREGNFRDNVPTGSTNMFLAGVTHYIELDVNNLRRWLAGEIGNNGPNALDQNGFVVYFSDRRGNRDLAGNETGEFGFEDFVNPTSGAGTPNGALDTGEDLNGNGVLDVYGGVPQRLGAAPLDATATLTTLVSANVARVNPPTFFRRALKLVNGGLNEVPMPGLTVASENPVYIEGDFNAAGGFGEPNAATAVLADAVTFLSSAWSDSVSLANPHNRSARQAATTWYRVAVVSGKGLAFPRPPSTPNDFGTDGGTHNFLRMLERWKGQTLNYRGSMITFWENRQAVGLYKCCSNVYSPPSRAYAFDVDFLDPTQLPPATPMFRDVNVLGFTHRPLPERTGP